MLSTLSLAHVRNYGKRQFSFDPLLTLIVGPNGAGKTNILEAIYLLARGESWRADDVAEMVEFGSEVGHVSGKIRDSDIGFSQVARQSQIKGSAQESPRSRSGLDISSSQLSVVLTRGVVGGKRVAKVKYHVDGVARRKSDFVGKVKVVLFEPESLEIVIGDPTTRRRFLDGVLLQTDREYARSLGIYARALRTRNRLLQAIRNGKARVESLEYWEREMIKHGSLIQNCRQAFIEWLDEQLNTHMDTKIPENTKRSRSVFRKILTAPLLQQALHAAYDPSPISEKRLDEYREREIAAGFTLVGPQRDELGISCLLSIPQSQRLDQQPITNHQQLLSAFGSRGEQRMAVLRLKLLEARWIKEKTEVSPIILLDDIFSELDEEHEKMVGELIEGRQAIITATEFHKGHYPQAIAVKL